MRGNFLRRHTNANRTAHHEIKNARSPQTIRYTVSRYSDFNGNPKTFTSQNPRVTILIANFSRVNETPWATFVVLLVAVEVS